MFLTAICSMSAVLAAAASLIALVALKKAVRVDNVSGKPVNPPSSAVNRQHVDIFRMYGRASRIETLCACGEILRAARLYTHWLNSLIERNLGAAARDLAADVYETADRDWNLAHIHNADGRGPDMSVFIPVGMSLEKIGAREFRFVVPPVPADLKTGEDRANSGCQRPESGKTGEDETDDLKG